MSFLLTKWYLDAVSDAGEACLGYAAELSAGPLRQRYVSLLTAAPGQAPRAHTALREARLPVAHGELVEWAAGGVKAAGLWRARAPALPTLELLDEPGALTWSCLQPRAAAELVHNGAELAGTGYVERLELRVPPWELPLEELHWGRAHVGERTVVWIDWRGPRAQRFVFVDGARVDAEVSSDTVRGARLSLTLEPQMTLREGSVAGTALARAPSLRQLLARHQLSLEEHKWLSRARLGGEQGWAIHEVVRWR